MKEICPNLYIGDENDYEQQVRQQPGWAVVHACKEPYHRQVLAYAERDAPKGHPEYLFAYRGNRLMLNLVNADNPAFVLKEIIDEAMDFIQKHLRAGEKVLVHCNQGVSRSPAIGLLYLAKYTDRLPSGGFQEAETAFRLIYPPYNPASGIRGFVVQNWDQYSRRAE